MGANWGGPTFPGSWARQDRTPKRPWNKARRGPPRPFGQNWSDGGHRHPMPLEEGVRESCLGEGTVELGFGRGEVERESIPRGRESVCKAVRLQ